MLAEGCEDGFAYCVELALEWLAVVGLFHQKKDGCGDCEVWFAFWVVLDVVAERLVESLSLRRVEYTGAEDCAEFLVDL